MKKIFNIDVRNYGSLNSEKCDSTGNESIPTSSSSEYKANTGLDPEGSTALIREHGLSILSAAIFVAAEMAGSGILALPKAIVQSGWIGIILLCVFALNAIYSGSRLGDCWSILEKRYPRFRDHTRNPYPCIAEVAIGKWGSYLVSGCIQLTLFGVGTVYLLLASGIILKLIPENIIPANMDKGNLKCWWFITFAAISCIPMWLGSPKDFWYIGIAALLPTIFACLMILVNLIIDGIQSSKPVVHTAPTIEEFFLAFGTILFAFGGASTFPTIQNDMNNREDFHISVRMAFSVIMILYIPIASISYFIYGDDVKDNIIDSLSNTSLPLHEMAQFLMAIHLILAFLIIINPVSQDLEEIFGVPNNFCVKRCILRTGILCLMILIGLAVPKFSNILSLVGGSTITLATFVLPPYLYMKLKDMNDSDHKLSLFTRIYCWILITVGIVGGIASTVSAVKTIITDPFSKPCFWPMS